MGMMNKAAVQAQAAVDQVVDTAALASDAKKLLEGTRTYIAAHPLEALGLAIAAGYLVGRLTR